MYRMVAFRATAPDHSRSKSASGRSSLLIPGSCVPGTNVTVGSFDEIQSSTVNAICEERFDVVNGRHVVRGHVVATLWDTSSESGKIAPGGAKRIHALSNMHAHRFSSSRGAVVNEYFHQILMLGCQVGR
jgi:hypothetical protein